jgi:hypothetical protein
MKNFNIKHSNLFFIFRWQLPKLLPKTRSKIGWIIEADFKSHFSHAELLLLQEIGGPLQAERSDKFTGRMIGQCPQFAMKLGAAHAERFCKEHTGKFDSQKVLLKIINPKLFSMLFQ